MRNSLKGIVGLGHIEKVGERKKVDNNWFKEHFPHLEIDGVWSILPDTARLLYQMVQNLQPKCILEFGSGVSTAVLAQASSGYGGFVFALEHQRVWLKRTQTMCRSCGLSNVEIIETDLVESRWGKEKPFRIYDPEKIPTKKYDFVFIDGPPGVTKDDPGRRGTLYAAWPYLCSNTVIILDDAHRPGEQAAVLEWMRVFGEILRLRYLNLRRAAFLMEKNCPTMIPNGGDFPQII